MKRFAGVLAELALESKYWYFAVYFVEGLPLSTPIIKALGRWTNVGTVYYNGALFYFVLYYQSPLGENIKGNTPVKYQYPTQNYMWTLAWQCDLGVLQLVRRCKYIRQSSVILVVQGACRLLRTLVPALEVILTCSWSVIKNIYNHQPWCALLREGELVLSKPSFPDIINQGNNMFAYLIPSQMSTPKTNLEHFLASVSKGEC